MKAVKGIKNNEPAVKHFQTGAGNKIRLVKTVCRARVALHFDLAKVGQTAEHLNDAIQIDEIIRPGIKHFKQLARHQRMQRIH
jgi:hypothetical protein